MARKIKFETLNAVLDETEAATGGVPQQASDLQLY